MRIMGLLVTGCLLVVLTVPAMAAGGDRVFRFGVVLSMPTDDLQDAGQITELDDATGFQAGFEFGVTDRLGIEPVFTFASHESRNSWV